MANEESLHAQLQAIGLVVQVKAHRVVQNNEEDQYRAGLVLHPEGYGNQMGPHVFLMNRHHMIEMAREILRVLDPTTEQEILDALQRIETRLTEKE